MHPFLRHLRARGSSLIEVMISMVILAIGILGVLQMSGIAAQQNNLATRRTAASFIGRDLVEAVDRMRFNHPALTAACGGVTTQVIYDRQNNVLNTQWANALPLLTATPAIVQADQKSGNLGGIEKIWWDLSCDLDPSGRQLGTWVNITVQMKMPGGNLRDLHFWTEKYNSQNLGLGNNTNLQEI